jgi:flagellar motor switch protein FliG
MASMPARSVENAGENLLLLAAESGFVAASISGLRKAAILMVAVGDELAKSLLQGLNEEDIHKVTDEITKLGSVPPDLLTQVLTEFYGLLETQQYMVRGGPDYAMKLLTEAFGVNKANALLAQVRGLQERSAGDLAMLQKMDPQQLSKFLESEHPQTVALVLAHLDAKRGAVLLMHLEESLRVQAVQRLAEMRQFSPEMAQKVAIILHRRLKALGSTGRRGYAGFKAVADLLNRLDQTASKGILEEIEQNEPKLAISIRTLMFTFEDLLTVPATSIRELVGAADKKTLSLALKGAKDNIKAHLFQAMSSRAIEMLKEDMDIMGPVRGRDVADAQQELLNLARKLEAEGKMTLKVEADDDIAI